MSVDVRMQRIIALIRENHREFVRLYRREQEQRDFGVLVFKENGENADVAYYPLDQIKSNYIIDRLRQMVQDIERGEVKLEGKMVITMPPLSPEDLQDPAGSADGGPSDPDELTPMFYVIMVGPVGRIFELLPQPDRSYLMVLDQSDEEMALRTVAVEEEEDNSWEHQGAKEYRKVVALAASDPRFFARFRSCAEFMAVVPGGSEEEGERLAQLLEQEHLDYDDFRTLDEVGRPFKYYYAECEWEMSPTTLRYIRTAIEIGKWFGTLTNARLLEVGASYGGLAGVLARIFPDIASYIGTEQTACLELARRYSAEIALPPNYTFTNQLPETPVDLLISLRTISQFNEGGREEAREDIRMLIRDGAGVFLEVEASSLPWFHEAFPGANVVETPFRDTGEATYWLIVVP